MLTYSLTTPWRLLSNLEGKVAKEERFWALKDVNFEVQQGEVVGIIGRNGAGKSTLLKILSRITEPTHGEAEIRGRITSLLEVGTGFHPELTGRENIYLNGAILGMSHTETERKFDQIVDFSEIDKFIDTPVKRYSSGMYVRLAFSVAAHLDTDVLFVDEVLAVGDGEFQKKCLGKIDDVRGQGRTVLVVSHNIPLIARLCQTAIWLDKGRVMAKGDFDRVSSDYFSIRQSASAEWKPSDNKKDFYYERVSIDAPAGSTPQSIPASKPFKIRFEYVVRRERMRGRIALQVLNELGIPIFSSANTDGYNIPSYLWCQGRHIEYCEIPGHLLKPGLYYLTISQPTDSGDLIIDHVCSFRVDDSDSLITKDGRLGMIAPLLTWRTIV